VREIVDGKRRLRLRTQGVAGQHEWNPRLRGDLDDDRLVGVVQGMQPLQAPHLQDRVRKALARRRTPLDFAIGKVEEGQMDVPLARNRYEATKVLFEGSERDTNPDMRCPESRDGLTVPEEQRAYDLGSPCKRR
jgi:hypothetical protein